MYRAAPLLAVLLATAAETQGASAIGGKKLLVKNVVPDDESRNRVVVVSRDPSIGLPVPGTVDDPRYCGTTMVVRLVGGPLAHEVTLPCLNWSLLGSETTANGYRYKDPELDDATVKSIVWKSGYLKITMRGRGPTVLGADLAEGVALGAAEAQLLGPSSGFCVRCTPIEGKDGADGKIFLGKEATCPAPPACDDD
jgi:hypothetical protein